MGFLTPTPPPFDLAEWRAKPHLSRIKPLAQDWAVNGFGTPEAVYLLYVVKLVVFALGGFLLISATTPGLGGLGDFGRLVDRADRVSEGRGLARAVGGDRPRLWLDAADLPLQPDDRRDPLLAPPGDGANAAVARQGATDRRQHSHARRRRPLRRRPRLGALPAVRRRGARRRDHGGTPRPGCDRGPAGLPRPPRSARQGRVPRRAPGDLRTASDRLHVPAREHDRRRADRLPLHLARRRRARSSTATSRSSSA